MNYCLDLFCDFTTATAFTYRRETLEDAELTMKKIYTAGQAIYVVYWSIDNNCDLY